MSRQFQRAARLRELLTYLVEQTLSSPDREIHEQDIGNAVFGRPPAYDSGADAIVRVQVAQLRKKLEQYFAEDGAAEPLVLEIAKGTYRAIFLARSPDTAPDIVQPAVTAALQKWRRAAFALAVGCLLLAGIPGFLLLRDNKGGAARDAIGEPSASVRLLWSQLLQPNRPVRIVLADSGFALLQAMLRRPLSLSEYISRSYAGQADATAEGDWSRALMRRAAWWQLTGVSDVDLVRNILLATSFDPRRITILSARELDIRALNSGNTILSGSRRSNPWVDVFAGSLNFAVEHDEEQQLPYVRNKAPRSGEKEFYRLILDRTGKLIDDFAVVAFLPNPAASGSVLILAGLDGPASEAAGRFVTTEKLFDSFRKQIAPDHTKRIPYFEVLLKTRKLAGSPQEVEVVARRLK
jgi:hypothetical protein